MVDREIEGLSTKTGGIRLFFQDEATFGRVSDLKYCWCQKDVRPVIHHHRVRENVTVIGAVEPASGEMVYSIIKKPESDKRKRGRRRKGERKKRTATKQRKGTKSRQFNTFMQKLSEKYAQAQIILVCDHAPWHKSKYVKIPCNIELVFIPQYTPEMNPIEQIWREIRTAGFSNKYFKTIEQVAEQLEKTIASISAQTFMSITQREWFTAKLDSV